MAQKYPDPILDTHEGECFLCHKKNIRTELHHVFGAANRSNSTKYGCVCYLCYDCHQGNSGVHHNKALWDRLRALTQAEFEVNYPELDFLKIFGKNWL